MVNLFRAEWRKIVSNRLVVSFTVWIFPIGALIIYLLLLLGVMVSEELRSGLQQQNVSWTDQMNMAWSIINNQFGRLLLLVLTAFIFASEYQWGTWKNIIPRSSRVKLVAAKFMALGAFVVIAYGSMTIVIALGNVVSTLAIGGTVSPALNDGPALSAFARDYALNAFTALCSGLIAACYTALGGIWLRSVIGGIAVGFLLTFAEESVLLVVLLLRSLIPSLSNLIGLHQFTPGYNLANIGSWATREESYLPPGLVTLLEPRSLEFSLVVVAVWLVVLLALILYLFRKQDILG
ncbi:MAG: ABC transporter permease [Pleurocapsa minor GSE-CHR-MK-17-07R]|jgi:ABC-type transport system involved in multi-copper enzyme maturation permease subunit|nr:ABC transporter permease [Pleurocapsa minor GSE-CHR-MK 17-07R]